MINKCPHCDLWVLLPEKLMNCKIYRHGVYKTTLGQIDPHLKKEECDRLCKRGLIYGCGKPFKITKEGLKKCGYI